MSDVMLIGILRMPLNLVFPSEPDAVMAFQIHARMGEAADRIEADEKKITRLLAVEVAAKELAETFIQWAVPHEKFYCKRCHSGFAERGPEINHKSNCEIMAINPIGDAK